MNTNQPYNQFILGLHGDLNLLPNKIVATVTYNTMHIVSRRKTDLNPRDLIGGGLIHPKGKGRKRQKLRSSKVKLGSSYARGRKGKIRRSLVEDILLKRLRTEKNRSARGWARGTRHSPIDLTTAGHARPVNRVVAPPVRVKVEAATQT
jgi:hypothetical protein